MTGTYAYTGCEELSYMSYVDLSTQKMLRAVPGNTYTMRTVESGFPVPPTDGRWKPVTSKTSSRALQKFRALKNTTVIVNTHNDAIADTADEAPPVLKEDTSEEEAAKASDSAAEIEEAPASSSQEDKEPPVAAEETGAPVADTHEEE